MHILNLVAKCIMKQFDEPIKKNVGKMEDPELGEVDDLAAALDDLEEELEDEGVELEMDWENDMWADMTTEEVRELEERVKPVRRVLSKVS